MLLYVRSFKVEQRRQNSNIAIQGLVTLFVSRGRLLFLLHECVPMLLEKQLDLPQGLYLSRKQFSNKLRDILTVTQKSLNV